MESGFTQAGVGIPLLSFAGWGGALAVIGLALMLGGLLIRRGAALDPADGPRGELWLLRAAAGLALVWLLALVVGQFHAALFAARWIWIAAGAAGWVWLMADLGRWHSARGLAGGSTDGTPSIPQTTQRSEPFGALTWAGWCVLGCYLLLLLPPALAPPLNYDVLEYHLGIVPHIFEQRRIVPIPGIFYTAQPLGTELLFTLAAVIEGNAWGFAPGLLQACLMLLGILVANRAMARLGLAAVVRPWLLLLIASHDLLRPVRLECKTDLTGLVMLAGGLWAWAVLRAETGQGRTRRIRLALLAGIFAGGALGAKWTNAGTVALPLILLMSVEGWRAAHAFKARVCAMLTMGGACAAMGFALWLPWGIWMAARAGNPLAPFMAAWFPTPAWTPQRLAFLIATHGGFDHYGAAYWSSLINRVAHGLPGVPLILLALLTLSAAALIVRFLPRAEDAAGISDGGRGPSLAALGWLAGAIVIALISWGKLQQAATRFLIPVMLPAAIVLGGSLQALLSRHRQAMVLAMPLLCFGLSLGPIRSDLELMRTVPYLPLALGRISVPQFQDAFGDATYELFRQANALPAGSRILTINEARRYPFHTAVRVTSVFDHNPLRDVLRGAHDVQTVLQRLREQGFTHILSNEFEQARILGMHTPPELQGNTQLQSLLRNNDMPTLTREFYGYTEFATEPLNTDERALYAQVLTTLRARAVWSLGGLPAMWIAAL